MGFLRLFLAICVVIGHTHRGGPLPLNGRDAVYVFFVISGYYMAMVLRGKYGFTSGGLGSFARNRLLRLYPTFVVAVLGTMAWSVLIHHTSHGIQPLFALASNPRDFPWWTLLGGWLGTVGMVGVDLPFWFSYLPQNGVFLTPVQPGWPPQAWVGDLVVVGPSWTVGAELCFYAVATLAARNFKWLAAFMVFSLALMIPGRALLVEGNFVWPCRLWIFLLGIGVFMATELPLVRRAWMRFIRPSQAVAAGLTIVTVGLMPLMGRTAPLVVLLCVVVFAVPNLFELTKKSAVDRYVGNLSYPLYLLHMLGAAHSDFICAKLGVPSAAVPWVTLGWGLMLAALTLHLVEQPIERIRRRIAASAGSQAVPAVAA